MITGVLPGPDGLLRCPWALSAPEYLTYHDNEWGQPVSTVQGLYERITLEAFQSGLSWITILRKRENFQRAFADFQPEQVATFTEDDIERLMSDPGIVRNRAKITAAINNARLVADLGARFAELVLSYRVIGRPRPAAGSGVRPRRSQSEWPESSKSLASVLSARPRRTRRCKRSVWLMIMCSAALRHRRSGQTSPTATAPAGPQSSTCR
jgi:DNA-3-methyladenine glycosylase I